MEHIKRFYQKYKHGIPMLSYMVVYLIWFAWLENRDVRRIRLIHLPVDDTIPFCEFFIIPYLVWFVYVTFVVIYLFFKDRQEYDRACLFLCTGMTLFLIISTLWPNGHHLRPISMPRHNIFAALTAVIWRLDTPTNLWPSIHVYNSMGACFALQHTNSLEGKRGVFVRTGSCLLSASIILSTVFIKQHSMFDVLTALGLSAVMYILVYRKDWLFAGSAKENKNKRTPQVG
jgi:membrane-associated phospholipid phosphatase